MSEYMGDISGYLTTGAAGNAAHAAPKKDNASLDMTDFLSLMVAQFQNQSIDNAADPSDMLNQLVQMSMIQAITNITDATVMMYAGSLVGKEVTVGQFDNEGKLQEIVGTVTGTGMSGGQQIVFVDGESYYLSDIMAVGRLPEKNQPADPENPEGTDGVEGTEQPEQGEGVPPVTDETQPEPEHSDVVPPVTDETKPEPEHGDVVPPVTDETQPGPEHSDVVPPVTDGTQPEPEQSDVIPPVTDETQPETAQKDEIDNLRMTDISSEIQGRRYADLLRGPLYWR